MIRIWINDPRSLGSWRIKGADESALGKDLSVPLMRHDPSDLGSLIQIRFIPKERTLYVRKFCRHVHGHLFYFQDCTLESDALCTSTEPSCPFKEYKNEKQIWIQNQLSNAMNVWNEDMATMTSETTSPMEISF